MYHFRPFRNADPPRLADIWRSQSPQRGLLQPVSAPILEYFVFSKPYFDPAGLIVALQDNVPIGFVHGGFGPNETQTALDTDFGTTHLLMLRGDHHDNGLADELLNRSEGYLRDRGAKVLYAGGIRPLNGFYLGLYGGSEMPGVLTSDTNFGEACRRNNYREIDRVVILERELSSFRPPVSRDQRQLRREICFAENNNPPVKTWWEACTTGAFERICFSLERGSQSVADVWFWDVEPLSSCWNAPTAGMFDLHVPNDARRKGLATFLLSDSFERLRQRGIVRVEAQTMQHNLPAIALYKKLGFAQVDEGVVFRKE